MRGAARHSGGDHQNYQIIKDILPPTRVGLTIKIKTVRVHVTGNLLMCLLTDSNFGSETGVKS
jgi:hypothetical protein